MTEHRERVEAAKSRVVMDLFKAWEAWDIPHDTPDAMISAMDNLVRLFFADPGFKEERAVDAILALTPPTLGGWRPEVAAFANLMEAQLRANDHKPGWKDEHADDLFPRIAEEADELWEAMVRHDKRLSWGDSWVMETDTAERIGREAADVANFAMMIADVCGALPAPPGAPEPAGEEQRAAIGHIVAKWMGNGTGASVVMAAECADAILNHIKGAKPAPSPPPVPDGVRRALEQIVGINHGLDLTGADWRLRDINNLARAALSLLSEEASR